MRFRPGQNLLEAVVAIGVILTAVIGSSTLIISSITAGRTSQNRIEAANFAREGIEIVRAMRDSNWLKFEQNEKIDVTSLPDWKYGFGLAANTPKSFILTYSATTLQSGWTATACTAANCLNQSTIYNTTNAANGNRTMYNQYLSLNACVNANAGTNPCRPTKYRRVVTLTLLSDTLGTTGTTGDDQSYILVQSTVNWTARTNPTTLTSSIRLYDWK